MINDRDYDDILPETIRDLLKSITGKDEGTWCYDWDPVDPQPIFDIATGQCLGTLQPIDYEAIAVNPNLHPHSRGKRS